MISFPILATDIDIDLQRKRSQIHGYGIFTFNEIQRGEIFYILPMEKILFQPYPRYAHIGNDRFLDDPKILNWVNHSCNPNAELVINIEQPYLKATKEIKIGEEVTVDYLKTEKHWSKIKCSCGEKNCNGYFYILR